MTAIPTREEAQQALDEYRAVADTYLIAVRDTVLAVLPPSIDTIVVVNEEYLFVNQIGRTRVGEATAGTIEEKFYMWEKGFRHGGGRLPEGKELYEVMCDAVLDEETDPFIMVTTDKRTEDYVRKQCRERARMNPGTLLESKHTGVLMYTAKESLPE